MEDKENKGKDKENKGIMAKKDWDLLDEYWAEDYEKTHLGKK